MGKRTGLPKYLSSSVIKAKLPNLTQANHRITSEDTSDYNCVAYAAGDERRKWDPYIHYWPAEAQKDYTIEALLSAFQAIGYSQCAGGKLEHGYQKVALFVNTKQNLYEHAARQNNDGSWSSKLGDSFDIWHKSPHGVEGPEYGKLIFFMKRKMPAGRLVCKSG